jgi:hypothetical protein
VDASHQRLALLEGRAEGLLAGAGLDEGLPLAREDYLAPRTATHPSRAAASSPNCRSVTRDCPRAGAGAA